MTADGVTGDGGSRHVVLVGLMGVGKSTVGRRLAKELERPFADADEQIELRAGLAIPALFRAEGEEAFRRLETEILAELVGRSRPLVLAAGGGAVNRPENRALLDGRTFVVWLRASARFVAHRADPTHRPLLAGSEDPETTLAGLLAEREPAYAAVAHAEVDVEPFHHAGGEAKRVIARHIADLVRAAGGASPVVEAAPVVDAVPVVDAAGEAAPA